MTHDKVTGVPPSSQKARQLWEVTQISHRVDEPHLWVWQGNSARSPNRAADEWRSGHLTVHTLRGSIMSTPSRLFVEFSFALQFPPFYGEPWSGLAENLNDLSWITPQRAHVVVFTDPSRILKESQDELPTLVGLLSDVCARWTSRAREAEQRHRPPVSFQVVLATRSAPETAQVMHTWREAGARLSRLR